MGRRGGILDSCEVGREREREREGQDEQERCEQVK